MALASKSKQTHHCDSLEMNGESPNRQKDSWHIYKWLKDQVIIDDHRSQRTLMLANLFCGVYLSRLVPHWWNSPLYPTISYDHTRNHMLANNAVVVDGLPSNGTLSYQSSSNWYLINGANDNKKLSWALIQSLWTRVKSRKSLFIFHT